MPHTVLLVGHCSMDSSYLIIMLKSVEKQMVIGQINDDAALAKALGETPGPDLLLINRQLDGMFSTYSGIELLAQLHQKYPALKLMLVSNFPEAQAAAQQAGALPGFGKAALRLPQTAQLLAQTLG